MAWHTPRTWAVGEFLTAALLNEQLRNNMEALRPIVGEYKFFARLPAAGETVIGGNYLECNGAQVSRSTYASLYALLNSMRVTRGSGNANLAAAMDGTTTTMQLLGYPTNWPEGTVSPYTFDNGYLIQVDSEKMFVTSIGAWPHTTLTVTRGREGTLAASHNSGAPVTIIADMPFGSGDGSSTFRVPDLHGRVPWSLGRTGFPTDVRTIGLDDKALPAARKPRHRHSWRTVAATAAGSQVNFAAGALGTAQFVWDSPTGGSPYNGYGIYVGSQDGPLDAPAHLMAGIWGIRFVGV